MKDRDEGELHGLQRPLGYEGLMEKLLARMGMNLTQCCRYFGLTHKTVQRMMSRCAACAESSTCHAILKESKNQIKDPPDFCYNRKALMAMSEEMEKMIANPKEAEQDPTDKR